MRDAAAGFQQRSQRGQRVGLAPVLLGVQGDGQVHSGGLVADVRLVQPRATQDRDRLRGPVPLPPVPRHQRRDRMRLKRKPFESPLPLDDFEFGQRVVPPARVEMPFRGDDVHARGARNPVFPGQCLDSGQYVVGFGVAAKIREPDHPVGQQHLPQVGRLRIVPDRGQGPVGHQDRLLKVFAREEKSLGVQGETPCQPVAAALAVFQGADQRGGRVATVPVHHEAKRVQRAEPRAPDIAVGGSVAGQCGTSDLRRVRRVRVEQRVGQRPGHPQPVRGADLTGQHRSREPFQLVEPDQDAQHDRQL